ncbi:MAG: hypothetical protein SFU98_20520 [Leptospiraceae bacterium]|nr:hypothetical protein [Leptospiraceae bacterium]
MSTIVKRYDKLASVLLALCLLLLVVLVHIPAAMGGDIQPSKNCSLNSKLN